MDSPQRIREHAMNDACLAVKNAKKKFKKTGLFQQVKYRSKKNIVQRFGFDAQSLADHFIFSKKKFQTYFKTTEGWNKNETLEGREVIYEDGRWFLIIPEKRNIKKPENQRRGVVSLDPGVRTFLSFYSEVANGHIGKGDFHHIYHLCLKLDDMISKISKAKCRKKRGLQKAKQKLMWRIFDLIDDLHKKTAHFFVTRYDTILIPNFETSAMVTKLNSKVARNMLTFAHFRFKEFLKIKAEEYSCTVIEVSEAYTSRTCSYCGKLHPKNSKRVMKCDCSASVDRDLNGARGILLKNQNLAKPLAMWAHTSL
jgi:putative transposase